MNVQSVNKQSGYYAALDLGTNNCRLLIACPKTKGFQIVESYAQIVHLGAGLIHTGCLSSDSMDKAAQAILESSKRMGAWQVSAWRCVATEACRRAKNTSEFVNRIKNLTGLDLEIISTDCEVRLMALSCLNIIDRNNFNKALIIDLGGGSTELIWFDVEALREKGEGWHTQNVPIHDWVSIPLGVVLLAELVPHEPDMSKRFQKMLSYVHKVIETMPKKDIFLDNIDFESWYIVGTSGTITSLAAIQKGLKVYNRKKVDGVWMQTDKILNLIQTLSLLPENTLVDSTHIHHNQVDLFLAGCAILSVLCEYWMDKDICVSDRGLREGMLLDMMVNRHI